MTSRTNHEPDELAFAIRSVFDDIVRATAQHSDALATHDQSGSLHLAIDPETRAKGVSDSNLLTQDGRRSLGRSRWVLSAAAVVLVVAGIGALATVRPSQPTSPATAPDGSTPPDGVDVTRFRFPEPLAPNLVPYLDPPPSLPENVDGPQPFEWVRGIDSLSLFGVRHDDRPASSVVVMETATPWDVISEGLPIETIGGTDAVIVRSPNETSLYIKDGSTTRAVFDANPLPGPEQPTSNVSAEVREVGQFIAGQSLDAVHQSDRIVQITTFGAGAAVVSYGPESETVLLHAKIPAALSDSDVPLAAELVAGFYISDPPNSLAHERVSLNDLIVAVAADQQLADAAIAAVKFDERASTMDGEEGPDYDQIEARGEPSWGRWELVTSTKDPTCWRVAATIWGRGNDGDEAGNCRDAGATTAVPEAFCLYMGDRIVGGLLGSDAVPEFVSPTDPTGFESAVEHADDTTSFQVRNADGQPGLPRVQITVDGTPLECSI